MACASQLIISREVQPTHSSFISLLPPLSTGYSCYCMGFSMHPTLSTVCSVKFHIYREKTRINFLRPKFSDAVSLCILLIVHSNARGVPVSGSWWYPWKEPDHFHGSAEKIYFAALPLAAGCCCCCNLIRPAIKCRENLVACCWLRFAHAMQPFPRIIWFRGWTPPPPLLAVRIITSKPIPYTLRTRCQTGRL